MSNGNLPFVTENSSQSFAGKHFLPGIIICTLWTFNSLPGMLAHSCPSKIHCCEQAALQSVAPRVSALLAGRWVGTRRGGRAMVGHTTVTECLSHCLQCETYLIHPTVKRGQPLPCCPLTCERVFCSTATNVIPKIVQECNRPLVERTLTLNKKLESKCPQFWHTLTSSSNQYQAQSFDVDAWVQPT